MPPRIFLLSPARADGQRMRMLLRAEAVFPLAVKLRTGELTLGEAFEFASGLYFRGKRAYARTYARPPAGVSGTLIIAPGMGLVPEDACISVKQLRAFGEIPVDDKDPRFVRPLLDGCWQLGSTVGVETEVVLLGSIASQKYVGPLVAVFGSRLLFPRDFVGRGDMSRGGLLLRAARGGSELPYARVEGSVRRGQRPPRLPALPRRGAERN